MDLDETLSWPFFDDGHRRFAQALARWADATLPALPHDDVDAACRARVKALADAGFLKAVVPAEHGGLHPRLDVRTLCLAREILAFRDGLADFAFAMQGLGTGSISLFGSAELQARYLPPVRDGRAIAAFALSEPEAGSDVAALAMTATPDGPSHLRIDGVKTWISNGGIADHYVVFARTGEAAGAKGLSAFVVDADAAGLAGRGTHRRDRAASARNPAVRRRARSAGQSPGQAGRRVQGRHGDARHLPLDRGRRRARLRPPGVARDRRTRREPQAVRGTARRFADDAGGHRRQRQRSRCIGAAGLSRRMDQGSGRGARHPRGRHGKNGRDRSRRSASSIAPCSFMVAWGSRRASRSRSFIARSGRCASTKARPRSRRS